MQNLGKYILFVFIFLNTLHLQAASDFNFTMHSNKTNVYLGEPVKISFIFKYKLDLQVTEANFNPPTFHDFWIKPGKSVPKTIENDYNYYHLDYMIYPQISGNITIEPARMDIGLESSEQKESVVYKNIIWQSTFSNALNLQVKPLPKGVTLFGKYTLLAYTDTNQTKANEPVNLTLKVTGNGNIEDIDEFVIHTEDAVVYADKAKRNVHIIAAESRGEMVQKFVFVSDKNFTIPMITLTYFDSNDKTIKTLRTNPIPITVKSTSHQNSTTKLEKKQKSDTDNKNANVTLLSVLWVAFISFSLGTLFTLFFRKKPWFKHTTKEDTIEAAIAKAKSDHALLALLLPLHNKTDKLNKVIEKLEANLYENQNYKIDRKDIAKNFQAYVTIRKDNEKILT